MTQLIPDSAPTSHQALLNDALQAAGVTNLENINGTLTVTSRYESVFSPGENPFLGENFRAAEVVNAVVGSFQDYDPQVIHEAFNTSESFSDVAKKLCDQFDVTHWSAAIGIHTVVTTIHIMAELA
jgi:hypothetical protein